MSPSRVRSRPNCGRMEQEGKLVVSQTAKQPMAFSGQARAKVDRALPTDLLAMYTDQKAIALRVRRKRGRTARGGHCEYVVRQCGNVCEILYLETAARSSSLSVCFYAKEVTHF